MMSTEEILPIHPDFARWYATVELGDDELRRESRCAGISALVQEANSTDIEALVRLAFKSRQPPVTEQVQKIRQSFKTADATFEMQGNDRELQILAAASLATMMHGDFRHGGEAALAATTAYLDSARKPDLPMDLLLLAESAINEIAENKRKRPALAAYGSAKHPKVDLEELAAKIRAAPNWETVAEAFTSTSKILSAAVTHIANRQANAMGSIDSFLKLQDEELDMLWWLIGQRSFDLDCAFDAIPMNAKPLVFGKELADSTVSLPGPASVKALLSRAGLKDRRKIALSSAINAADDLWLQSFIPESEPSLVSTPIHFAIRRRLETGAGDTWIAGWAAASGVAENHAVTPLTLGLLFYRERLLLEFCEE